MADVPAISGKVTVGVGETFGFGPFGQSGSITFNEVTGEPQMNFQAAAFDISGKISYSESGGLTIAFGQGNIFGFGAGTSEFAGVQWNSNNGFGLQLSGSVNGANGA